jgi:Phosphotransferase enzyme family
MVPMQRFLDQDLALLLGRAVARTRIGLEDGKSGTPIERLHFPDGTTVVVKHVRPYGDWIMRATHDAGRAVALWDEGTMDQVPSVIDHAVIGVVAEPGGWALVMGDVEHSLVPGGRLLTREESRRIIAAVHALHTRFADANLAGLVPLADRYTVLGPQTATRERDGADAVPKLVERGWALFAERVGRDVAGPVYSLLDNPTELVTTLAQRRLTLVHGDLKVPNLGLRDGRVVLLDWGTMTGMAPPAVEWAWYLAISAGRIAARREDILDDIRAAEGETHDPAALSLSLLGGLLQLGWNKALDAFEHPDAAVRARERRDLEWWVATARGVLDAWPLHSTT